METPILSIITINYNNRAGLERTIQSVISQSCRQLIEYIIIDGNSSDGSKGILKKFSSNLDYWVSEPDKGIYNAMNKGTQNAHGKYCLYLNSGDWLYEDIYPVISKIPKDIDLFTKRETGRLFKWAYGNRCISFSNVLHYSLHHSNTLIKRELINRLGGYDETYKIVSDWKFFLIALFKENATIDFFNDELSFNEPYGISSSQMEMHLQERQDVINSLFPSLIYDAELLMSYKRSRIIRMYNLALSCYKRIKGLI